MEARNDQHTARKAWSDQIVECCSKKIQFTREKGRIHRMNFTPPICTPHILKVVQYVFLQVEVAECGYQRKQQRLVGNLLGWKVLERYFVFCYWQKKKFQHSRGPCCSKDSTWLLSTKKPSKFEKTKEVKRDESGKSLRCWDTDYEELSQLNISSCAVQNCFS